MADEKVNNRPRSDTGNEAGNAKFNAYSTYSAPILNSIETGQPMTQVESEEYRDQYLSLIVGESWKDDLIGIANEIQAGLEGEVLEEDNNLEYCIKVGHDILNLNQRIITLGRFGDCDYKLPSNQGCSRCHAIIFIFKNHVIVVDPGSFFGIKTIRRKDHEKGIRNSLPNARMPLVFGRNETFVLMLGEIRVAFSPLLCIVCDDQPRGVRSPCGHFAMCHSCATENMLRGVDLCPVCRNPNLGRNRSADHAQTFVGAEYTDEATRLAQLDDDDDKNQILNQYVNVADDE